MASCRLQKLSWLIACAALVCLIPLQALAFDVTLAWDASSSPDVSTYVINQCTEPGVYTSAITVGNVTTGIVSNLTSGEMYYFAISCRDIEGLSSGYSNEVFTDGVTVIPDGEPPLSPGGCVITTITP